MTPPKIYTNFINGGWKAFSSRRAFENLNPANRSDLIGYFQKANHNDVDAAVGAATLLQANKEKFGLAITREMGK